MADLSDFKEWLKANPPPDPQKLADQYGSYSAIPTEAFLDFTVECELWEGRRKDRLFGSGTWRLMGGKKYR